MSTHAANSLISDLAEMVKAVEELPQVQQELGKANELNSNLTTIIETRDGHIHDLEAQIAALQASLKSAEANRDDAELRFLEIEERFTALASAVTGAHSLVAVANAVAEPQGAEVTQPKADPTAEAATPATEPPSVISSNADNAASVQSTEQGESASPPIASSESLGVGSDTPSVGESATDPIPTGTTINTPASEGVSVSTDPTNANASEVASYSSAASEPTTVSTQSDNGGVQPSPLQSSPVPTPITTLEVAASANGSANPSADVGGAQARPYEGKAYSEAVGYRGSAYIPLSEWTKGGGTEDNYYR